MASTKSPEACLMASAANSGSYNEPSPMTRSTANVSWERICATDSSAMLASPRRWASSRRHELSMAAAPHLTATYISDSLQSAHAGRAGQAHRVFAAGKNDVHTLGKRRVVCLPLRPEVVRQARQTDT